MAYGAPTISTRRSASDDDSDAIDELLQITGRLPLAIKWAVSLADTSTSLREVVKRLKGHNIVKREFLSFCFSTMFNELSTTARNIAILCPYLGDDWNVLTLSISLDKTVGQIEAAVKELEDRGILLASVGPRSGAISVLPLTMDFLSQKWHENKKLREEVTVRISSALASPNFEGNVFNWPVNERVRVLYEKALEHERIYEYDDALKLLKLAMRWCSESSDVDNIIPKLMFTEGRIIYKSIDKRDGIRRMQLALDQIKNPWESVNNEILFLAEALLFHGRTDEEIGALKLIVKHLDKATQVKRELVEDFCIRAMRLDEYSLLVRLMEKIKEKRLAYWLASAIFHALSNNQVVFVLGEVILNILRLAAAADDATEEEAQKFREKLGEIESLFSAGINTRTQ